MTTVSTYLVSKLLMKYLIPDDPPSASNLFSNRQSEPASVFGSVMDDEADVGRVDEMGGN